jgi:hypothetical protein
MAEFSSFAKHYINFGAINALGIAGPAGAKLLTKVQKGDWKDDRKAEAKKAAGVRQGAGFRRSQGGGTVTLTVYRETGPAPEVNWMRLQDDEKVFTYTVADEKQGQRINFTCTVSNIDGSSDENGENMMTVVLAYTKRYYN